MSEEKKSPKLYSVEEKLFFVFESLHRAIEMSAEEEYPRISLSDRVFNFVTREEFEQITNKFAKEKTIKIKKDFEPIGLHVPLFGMYNCFYFKPLSVFKKGFKKYEKEYQNVFYKGQNVKNSEKSTELLTIEFKTHSNEIILNDLFLLSKPHSDSENDQVFHYLYDHPNKKITKARLKKNGIQVGKSFTQIIRDLGFLGNLGKVFFISSEKVITFRNPVTKEILDDLGITRIRLHTKKK